MVSQSYQRFQMSQTHFNVTVLLQSPDLNPIEIISSDQKSRVHNKRPSKPGKISFIREEWPKKVLKNNSNYDYTTVYCCSVTNFFPYTEKVTWYSYKKSSEGVKNWER